MATQIVILNNDSINVDDSYLIAWADKGNSMPTIANTVHCVLWNNLPGQNEIQNKDASTGNMTTNTDLNSTSDAVGSTTVAALLTWAETRKGQINSAETAYENAVADDAANGTTNAAGKTWRDYDPNYS
jgi:hypothetical protein|tara:strand:+ start:616 stop:1002 length:387 start_codon:yes stop_codon:yes gene_type:complete